MIGPRGIHLLFKFQIRKMSSNIFDVAFNTGKEKYARSSDKIIQYGTAGFRTRSDHLDHVMYRMGLLAALRSKKLGGKTIGVMITASHNPEEDNGVKLVDPRGEMLEQSWELNATVLANSKDDELKNTLQTLVKREEIPVGVVGSVVVGRDTRTSSLRLSSAVITGIQALSTPYTDFGVVSTPMLHYFVRCKNTNNSYGTPNEEGYFKKLSDAFKQLNSTKVAGGNYTSSLTFDGANGVGALKMVELQKHISNDLLNVEIHNNGNGKLNLDCGADFVKVQQKAPTGVPVVADKRCVSFDGDADRLIYYYVDEKQIFHMLDGDRIATLLAGYLMSLLSESGLKSSLNLGLVQTAYANGSSTDYITNKLKVPVACVPTGVKFLHHRAEQFDVGVYFEANGHGTVVFSENAEKIIEETSKNETIPQAQKEAATKLSHVINLTNQTVGDSISDLLLVETVLRSSGWDIKDWEQSYSDLPNRQLKVRIKDRNVVQTTDAERQCVQPLGLQDQINLLVGKYDKGRSFVRASGTEDVVRVYAEASSQSEADRLASEVSLVVFNLAEGVGEAPKLLGS